MHTPAFLTHLRDTLPHPFYPAQDAVALGVAAVPAVIGARVRAGDYDTYLASFERLKTAMPDMPVEEMSRLLRDCLLHVGAVPLLSLGVVKPLMAMVAGQLNAHPEWQKQLREHPDILSVGLVFAAGIGYELYQHMSANQGDMKDIAANALGAAIALIVPKLAAALAEQYQDSAPAHALRQLRGRISDSVLSASAHLQHEFAEVRTAFAR